jgi:hypothetical protein
MVRSMRSNRREPLGRGPVLRSLGLALLALAAAATVAEAGSAKAPFTVSATVIANCATRGQTVVCSKGVTPPKTQITDAKTSEAAVNVQGHPFTSQTEQPQVTVVTINY